MRNQLIRSRCNLTNAIRSFAAEFGLTAPSGDHHPPSLFHRIESDEDLPTLARELFAIQVSEYDHLRARITEVNEKLQSWHRSNKCTRPAGKVRLGTITRAGDEDLRRVLVVGATSLLRQFRAGRGRDRGALSSWLHQLLQRKPPKLVAVALANKVARTAWKLMITGQTISRGPRKPRLAAFRSQSDTGAAERATVLTWCQNLQGKLQMV